MRIHGIILGISAVTFAYLPEVRSQEADLPKESFESDVWESLKPQSQGFTSAMAAASARQASPQIAVAKAKVVQSLARTGQTLSRYVPNVSLEATYRRINSVAYDFGGGASQVGALNPGLLGVGPCPDNASQQCVLDANGAPVGAAAAPAFNIPNDNFGLTATLSVPFSDYLLALPSARRGAEADETSAKLQLEAEKATVDVNARIAYYDWVKAQAQVAIARESLASSKARLDDARRGLEAGTITSADAMGLESLAASSEIAVTQAESFLRVAEQNLRLNTQYDGPLQMGEDLSSSPTDIQSLGTLEELIAKAKRDRAELQSLKEATTASDEASDGRAASLYPRLDGIASVTHANPNQQFFPPSNEWNTSWFVGLNASWRLDSFLNARAQVKELDANTQVLRSQRVQMERAVELEVRSAWEEWQRADAAARISAAELAAAEAMHEQRATLFRGGEATSTDVSEAEFQRANATLRKINASIDKRIALARMARAAGIAPAKAVAGE